MMKWEDEELTSGGEPLFPDAKGFIMNISRGITINRQSDSLYYHVANVGGLFVTLSLFGVGGVGGGSQTTNLDSCGEMEIVGVCHFAIFSLFLHRMEKISIRADTKG